MSLHLGMKLSTHQRLLFTKPGLQPTHNLALPQEREELGGVSWRKEKEKRIEKQEGTQKSLVGQKERLLNEKVFNTSKIDSSASNLDAFSCHHKITHSRKNSEPHISQNQNYRKKSYMAENAHVLRVN